MGLRKEPGVGPNLLCIFVSLEADEAKSLRFAALVSHNPDTECRSFKIQQLINTYKHAKSHW